MSDISLKLSARPSDKDFFERLLERNNFGIK